MSRAHRRLALTSASTSLLVLLLAAAVAQGQPPVADPERGFAFGDTNLDGKLSLEEFRELVLYGPRLKNAAAKRPPAMVEPAFRRLDTNQDGHLTLQEYRRIGQLRPGGGAGFPGAGGPFMKGGLGPFAKAKGAFARKKAAENGPVNEAPSGVAEKPVTPDQARFFETKIRPVLMTSCAKCHSADAEKLQGGLLVDSREGLRKGGDTGPAVVPGNLEESLLITALRFKDESLQMPPKKPLPPEVVADFEAWVNMGAPDPADWLLNASRPARTPPTSRRAGNSGPSSLRRRLHLRR
ncbi:MAG: c-type cytochrome domain-containing protein [Isosphaeraceae bacterium]